MHIALPCQNHRLNSLPLYASGEIQTHDPAIIDKAVLPPPFQVERCLSRPNRAIRSCAKTDEIMKSLFTCPPQERRGRHLCMPKRIEPTHGGYWPTKFRVESVQWLGLHPGLDVFCKSLCNHTWHVRPVKK